MQTDVEQAAIYSDGPAIFNLARGIWY